MSPTREVKVGKVSIGNNNGLVLIAGPCVIESRDLVQEVAGKVKELAEKLVKMEKRINKITQQTGRHDKEIRLVFEAIRKLMVHPDDGYKRTKTGFIVDK